MRIINTALLLIFFVILLVFCLQNLTTVDLKFLSWGVTVPMPLLIVGVYLFGMLSGWGVVSFLRKSIRGVTHKSTKAE